MATFHPLQTLPSLAQHLFCQRIYCRVLRFCSRVTRADPREVHTIAALDFFDELNEVAAIDVEVRINSAFGLGLRRAIMPC